MELEGNKIQNKNYKFINVIKNNLLQTTIMSCYLLQKDYMCSVFAMIRLIRKFKTL